MKSIDLQRTVTEAARNQFDSCYRMLKALVEVCPDDIWYSYFHETPFWYQVYHVAYFIDYWFRDDYKGDIVLTMHFDERIPPEFEHDIDPGLSISREETSEYLQKLHVKTVRIFDRLDDAILGQEALEGETHYTYTDIILSQVRHIMYNTGYLNGILREKGLSESDWWAYNEDEE